MSAQELLDFAFAATMLAVALHWFFRFGMELHWAVCICALSLIFQPWIRIHVGLLLPERPVSDFLVAAAIAAGALTIADHLHWRIALPRRRVDNRSPEDDADRTGAFG